MSRPVGQPPTLTGSQQPADVSGPLLQELSEDRDAAAPVVPTPTPAREAAAGVRRVRKGQAPGECDPRAGDKVQHAPETGGGAWNLMKTFIVARVHIRSLK